MALLARGGFLPVITPTLMGIGFILVSWFVDPLHGIGWKGLGILMLMIAAFFANFWRDPDRPIPRDEGVIVSPADGHVMFVKEKERLEGAPQRMNYLTQLRTNILELGSKSRVMNHLTLPQSKDGKQSQKEKKNQQMYGELRFSCLHSMST